MLHFEEIICNLDTTLTNSCRILTLLPPPPPEACFDAFASLRFKPKHLRYKTQATKYLFAVS